MATFQAGDFPIDPNTVDGTELAARLNRMKVVLDKTVINGENVNVGIGVTNPVTKLDVEGRARFLQDAAATTGAVIIRQDITNTVGGYLQWVTNDSSAQTGYIGVLPDETFVFGHTNSEKMRIDKNGNLGIGTAKNYGGKLNVLGKATYNTDTDEAVAGAGSYKFRGTAAGTTITTWDYLNYTAMEFIRGTGDPLNKVGSITCTDLATAYNTASDYRLKENVAPMTGGLATVAKLKPCTYTWKSNGEAGQGFIAHELQAVVPDCVTGEKDAVDKDGNPQYQGVDTSFLVATLVAAIQELKGEVDALKAAHPKVVTK